MSALAMSQSNNWAIGMTLDKMYNVKPSPFTTKSFETFAALWDTTLAESNYDQAGTFKMNYEIVTSNEQKMRAMDVKAGLSATYMKFTVCSATR